MDYPDITHEVFTQNKAPWSTLPAEIWLNIFKFLPQPTLLFGVPKVCHLFKDMAMVPELWRSVNLNSFEWKSYDLKQMTDSKTIDSVENSEEDSNIISNLVQELVDRVIKYEGIFNLYDEETEGINHHFLSTLGIDELMQYCEDLPPLLNSPRVVIGPLLNAIHESITELIFSRSTDFNVSDSIFHKIVKCTNLTRLDVGFCESVDDDCLSFVVHHLQHLSSLGLEGCECVNIY